MSDKLLCKSPDDEMVIRQVHPSITTLSVPFYRFGRISIGGRGTIVRLTNGDLAVFSPVALTDNVRSTLSSLGNKVRYITAPDIEHHISLDEWHKAFPDAKLLAPDDLKPKREKSGKPLPWAHLFSKPKPSSPTRPSSDTAATAVDDTTTTPAEYSVDKTFDSEFDVEFVSAHPNKELVFNHRPSGTLIQADFMFNLPATEQNSRIKQNSASGWMTWLFSTVNSTAGTAIWQKRLLWYGLSAKDRKGFNASVRRVDGWKWDRMVPCHGDVIETGAKGVFRKVFEWHLQGTANGKRID